MMLDQKDAEFVRQLQDHLRQSPEPFADDALRARIHATLETAPPVARPSAASRLRWRRAMIAAAAVVLVAVLLRDTGSATAGAMAGVLHFDPAAPRPGQEIRVRYEPSAPLARFDHLRLRARFRTARDVPSNWLESQVVAARLERDRSGAFVGSFVFPDSAVFGAFAVEDDDARWVDANRRSLWTLLASDSAGTPTFEALEQRINDVATTNWELALATAKRATELHPDQVRGWVILLSLQQSILGRAERDSVLAAHRARLPALDERFASGTVDPDELGAMVSYAEMLRDAARASRWGERLARSNPRGVWGINAAANPGFAQLSTNPRAALAFFDSLWVAVGAVHPGITNFGLAAAQAVKDSAAVATWFHRALAAGTSDTTQLATAMVHTPGLEREAMALLRTALRLTPDEVDRRRALEHTRAASRPEEEDRRAHILETLGDALVARGQLRAGVDTLAAAASIGWNPPLYRKLASAAFTMGDTGLALDALAHAAADPLAEATVAADSARLLAGRAFDAGAWGEQVERARAVMRQRMLARAERTSIPEVTVTDSSGRPRRLADLVAGRPTLVAFWSMHCPYSVAQHATLAATARRLSTLGYNSVALTHEPLDSTMLATLAAQRLDFPAYRDQNNEARLAFAQWGTPEYFVLDGTGRIRFRLTTLANAAAQLASVDER